MTQLNCGVNSCIHNQDKMCCKGDITIGGKHACCTSDTCCDSFCEKKDHAYVSAIEHPSKIVSIDCEATKCMYNSNYKCHAEHVAIKGFGAKKREGTLCETFREA